MNSSAEKTQLLGSFHEFFIVFIHALLYVRRLYPERSFELVRQYGIAIHQNRHPALCEWIEGMAMNCMRMIKNGSISKISVVILQGTKPMERFVIDIMNLCLDNDQNVDDADSAFWNSLGEQYRACLVKLTAMEKSFGPLPDNCTFTILLESELPPPNDEATLETWVIANGRKFKQDVHNLQKTAHSRLKPVENVQTDRLAFNIWFEEDKPKTKLKT